MSFVCRWCRLGFKVGGIERSHSHTIQTRSWIYNNTGVCLRAFGHAHRDGFGAPCLACPPGTLLCCSCRRVVRSNELEDTFPSTLVPLALYTALKIPAPGVFARS